jgi:hypothetical protein
MAHKVMLYDVDAGYDADGYLSPVEIIETDDADEAIDRAISAIRETGSISASHISVDWRLCETLEDWFRITNATSHWLKENPIEGAWIGTLSEDLDYWAASGITTPEQIEKYLLIQSYSDNYKECFGVRPHHNFTMETPIEEVEAAYDRLRPTSQDDASDPEPC